MGVQRSINRNTQIYALVDRPTNPPISFGDADTGFFQPADDVLATAVGALESARITELSSGFLYAFAGTATFTALAGGAQGGAGVLINTYTTVTVVATVSLSSSSSRTRNAMFTKAGPSSPAAEKFGESPVASMSKFVPSKS